MQRSGGGSMLRRARLCRLAVVGTIVALAVPTVTQAANEVTKWNEIAVNTVLADQYLERQVPLGRGVPGPRSGTSRRTDAPLERHLIRAAASSSRHEQSLPGREAVLRPLLRPDQSGAGGADLGRHPFPECRRAGREPRPRGRGVHPHAPVRLRPLRGGTCGAAFGPLHRLSLDEEDASS